LRALCFTSDDLITATRHFHPRGFIEHFRKCGWLSNTELAQIYPAASAANRTRYLTGINKSCRKYLLTGLRAGNFFGQSAVECASLAIMTERHNPPDEFTYFRKYEKARNYAGHLGNILWNDGATFKGRGMKQLTGRANYAEYWLYRGWISTTEYSDSWWRNVGWWGIQGAYIAIQHGNLNPIQDAVTVQQLTQQMRPPVLDNPGRIADNVYNSIDTACWFWAKNSDMENNNRSLLYWANQNNHIMVTRIIRGDGEAQTQTEQAYESIETAQFAQRRDDSNRIRRFLGDIV
jgi:hydroxyethylthiazole kinase